MKNVSKICLGLVTLFSLTACGKGTKVKREKFFEKCADIKKDNLKKAKVTYRSIKKSGYDSDVEQNRENYTGIYVKDEFGYWDKGSETNDDEVDDLFSQVVSKLILNKDSKENNYFEYGLNGYNDNENNLEEKYYIKPFIYEYTLKRNKSYPIYDDYLDDSKSSSYVTEYSYEWNDYGYLTKAEGKRTENIEYSDGTKYTSSEIISVKITYK